VDSFEVTSLWTGNALLGFNSGPTVTEGNRVVTSPGAAALWDAATNRWTVLPSAPYAGSSTISAVWTGSQLLEWGLMTPDLAADTAESARGLGVRSVT
jgi:hypothetical protein